MSTSPYAAPAPHIPDFDLLRQVGSGSYGEVWLARSVTGAWRAVKVVRRGRFNSARPYDREFEGIQKYEPVSRSTEGLVHLLHVSRGDDFFYYVMELADDAGQDGTDPLAQGSARLAARASAPNSSSPLRQLVPERYIPRTVANELTRRRRLSFAECVSIGIALAKGLEQLHASGLVHRDIKPSNIIFVNGAPRLADIGLVADANATRTVVGTEGYLPPEGGGTASADLYSFGKVLFEIATGQDRHDFPVMPADFAGWPDRAQILELSEIFERACEALPSERYTSATELRADLELLASGESIVRRHRVARGLRNAASAAFFLVIAGGLIALGGWWQRSAQPVRNTSAIARANTEWQAGVKQLEKRSPESLASALAHFDRAVELDSDFILPVAGRAEALVLLASYADPSSPMHWRDARIAAESALSRATNLATPHFVLGLVAKNHEFDWPKAERHFRAGLVIDSNSALGLQWYSSLLGALGRPESAVEEARRALELDPSSRSANANLAIQLHLARRYEEAIAQYRRTLALAPDFAAARMFLSRLYLATERIHEGLMERLRAIPETPEGKARRDMLDNERMRNGSPGYWRTWLAGTEVTPSTAFARAEALHQLNDAAGAIEALREAIAHRDSSVIYLAVDPIFDPLRNESSFLDLCDQLKLPRNASVSAVQAASAALTEEERAAGLSPEEKAAGFRVIFDSRTLRGWKAEAGNWGVQDGALVMIENGINRPSHLLYTAQTVPDNFELRFEWKVHPGGDGGVNYRPGLVQYQVVDNAVVSGTNRFQRIAGALLACIGSQHHDHTRPVGEWNEARIVCYGTTIEHHLNNRMQFRFNYSIPGLSNLVASLDFEEMKRIQTTFGNVRARGGYLSLQDEGLPGTAFRHLRWRRLE